MLVFNMLSGILYNEFYIFPDVSVQIPFIPDGVADAYADPSVVRSIFECVRQYVEYDLVEVSLIYPQIACRFG